MSVLTKILIVLLTLASIFLCGTVVTYVGNADNYKQKSEDLRKQLQAAKENEKNAIEREKENTAKSQRLQDELNKKIASLKIDLEQVQGKLTDTERQKALLEQKVNNWVSTVEAFTKTADNKEQLLKNTIEELNKVQAEQIKTQKELKDTSASLLEKMAIIETLETEKKRLLEQKTELQSKLDKLLQPFGKQAAAPIPVTPERTTAKPMKEALTSDIGLKGLVANVDLKNRLASISIGKADGVKEGMKFCVYRGDEYICDILIITVDSKESVGVLELVQQEPKVGDKVSTNL